MQDSFFRGFFPWVCWPHAQNKLFFSWLTPASAFVRFHSCWMHVSGAHCLYSVYIIFSHKVAAHTAHGRLGVLHGAC